MCANLLSRDHFSRMLQENSQYCERLARQFQADSVTAEFSRSQIESEVCEAQHAALGADSHGKSRGDAHGVYHCGPPSGLRRQSAHSLKLSHIKGLAVDLEIDSQLTCCELYPLPDKPYFLGA